MGNDQAVGVTQLLCCWCSEADRRRAEGDPKPGTDGENHADLDARIRRPWGRAEKVAVGRGGGGVGQGTKDKGPGGGKVRQG